MEAEAEASAPVNPPVRAGAYDPARKIVSRWIAPPAFGLAGVPVCVMRTYLASTGANSMVVFGFCPGPCATGALHVVPSVDTCTL